MVVKITLGLAEDRLCHKGLAEDLFRHHMTDIVLDIDYKHEDASHER
jgi:hypothetical protein